MQGRDPTRNVAQGESQTKWGCSVGDAGRSRREREEVS